MPRLLTCQYLQQIQPRGTPRIPDLCRRAMFEEKRKGCTQARRQTLTESERSVAVRFKKGKSTLIDTSKPRNGWGSVPSGRTKGDFCSSGVSESVPWPSVSSLAGKAVAKPSLPLRLWLHIIPAHVQDAFQCLQTQSLKGASLLPTPLGYLGSRGHRVTGGSE